MSRIRSAGYRRGGVADLLQELPDHGADAHHLGRAGDEISVGCWSCSPTTTSPRMGGWDGCWGGCSVMTASSRSPAVVATPPAVHLPAEAAGRPRPTRPGPRQYGAAMLRPDPPGPAAPPGPQVLNGLLALAAAAVGVPAGHGAALRSRVAAGLGRLPAAGPHPAAGGAAALAAGRAGLRPWPPGRPSPPWARPWCRCRSPS